MTGRVAGPVAVLLPGAGSSADFVRRAFGAALAEYELVAVPPTPGPAVVSAAFAALDAAAAAYGPRLRLVGGVSLGAQVAARWAAGRPLDGLLLALPAWTGPAGTAGSVAAATAAAAEQVDRLGTAGALAAARAGGVDWVAEELAAAWPAYGELLAPTLRAAAAAPGPSAAELRSLDLPVGVVAFADDPLHPLTVAEEWAALLPRAALRQLRLADLAADRGPLGTAAVAALAARTAHSARTAAIAAGTVAASPRPPAAPSTAPHAPSDDLPPALMPSTAD